MDNPQTYNEKLQWLKLYDRRPEYTIMVDKYAVKKWVADRIGEEHIIPTLGVWNRFDEIDFENLPDQFVLKCTHDSGGLIICKDKSLLDRVNARKTLEKCLKRNFYWVFREWPYKNVPPRIIAEEYMSDGKSSDLKDYKFFCFNGKVRALFVATERFNSGTETRFDFFDENYNHLNITNGHPNADHVPQKPINFALMKEYASILSEGIPHVRVDFYEANGKVYFGELTFFHWSGVVAFEPPKWDRVFGDWLALPEKKTFKKNQTS